jgi:DNA-binding response OmpR family regulator
MTALGAARERYGPYVVTGFLGQGGMCTVYAARHEPSGRRVALKVMSGGPQARLSTRQRFLLEWSMAVSLRHPNLIEHLEAGEDDGDLYLALELMSDGDSLRLLERFPGGIPEELLARIGADVARGLAELHARGLVHRDVKPENIFVAAGGMAKLGDFGLVKRSGEIRQLTTEGFVLGTPDYMAPEQARAERDIDSRCDQYGLGAALYRLATGLAPFDEPTAWGVLTQIVSQPFPDPRALRPELSERMGAVILKACAKERGRRFADATAMAAACEAVTTRHPRPTPLPTPPEPEPAAPPEPTTPMVLLVDDDPVISRLYRSRFTNAGFEVEIAATAHAAVEHATRRLPQAIVLDLGLPDADGLEVLRAVRALPGAAMLPIVVLTNAYSPDRIRAAQEAGASAVHAKAALSPRAVSDLTVRLIGSGGRASTSEAADLPLDEFRLIASGPLHRMHEALLVLGEEPTPTLRDRAVRDLAEICRGFAAASSAAAMPGPARVASAAELLARHLLQQPQDLNVSLRRTLREAVSLLRALSESAPSRAGRTSDSLRALIVDDDPIVAKLALKAVQRVGMAARSETDPEAGLAAATAESFDIVVLDVMMPGMSGTELAKRIRGSGASRDAAIVFITSLKDFTPPSAVDGTIDLIAKPFPMMELATKALTLAERGVVVLGARDS